MATRKPSRTKPKAPASRPRTKKTARRKTAGVTTRERRRQERETLRLRAVQPSFTVNDLERSLRFYLDVLGFFEGERWTEGGALRGVMLKAGACELGLSQDDWSKGRDRRKGEGVRLSCLTVQDIDALATRIKAGGWRLTEEPHDQPWGRTLSVDDPDGYHLTIYSEP